MQGMADPLKVKDFWTDTVTPAYRLGKIDKIPTRQAVTPRDRDIAAKQQAAISKRSFGGFHPNYERIKWL